MKTSDILSRLLDLAQNTKPVRAARIAAAVVHRGEIISMETNIMKSHPFQKRFAKNPEAIYLHAETFAIMKALKKISVDDIENCEVYIARAKKNDHKEWTLGNSHPCDGCLKCLVTFGIKKVYYTCEEAMGFVCL
jgi:tRNA(Arg) A34 adenosine deaminase TadA